MIKKGEPAAAMFLRLMNCSIWSSDIIPPDWKKGIIIPFWKGKCDCLNSTVIRLLHSFQCPLRPLPMSIRTECEIIAGAVRINAKAVNYWQNPGCSCTHRMQAEFAFNGYPVSISERCLSWWIDVFFGGFGGCMVFFLNLLGRWWSLHRKSQCYSDWGLNIWTFPD